MNYFRRYNLIFGWIAFAVSAFVYIMTVEPTVSLWDCAEYAATSFTMGVGHPPGAPLFMMVARIAMMLAPSPASAAFATNILSALCGAFTVLFLFWIITHFARKIYAPLNGDLTKTQSWTVIGAGLIGSLAYCFTDSQWFSSTETEVYAMALMFTAMAVWAMLQWEKVADEPRSGCWLILVAYILGLSMGARIINLLAIPSLVFIYYFRKYPKVTKWGVVKATAVAVALLGLAYGVMIPYTAAIGAQFDKLFVNSFGLPPNSGLAFFIFAAFGLAAWGIYFTHRKRKLIANTVILCFTVMMLGYTSYAAVLIRASANTPMNSNDPSNAFALLSMLNREQYGSNPLVYGPFFTSPATGMDYRTVTFLDEGRYRRTEVPGNGIYPDRFKYFFPRIYSTDPSHIKGYDAWGGKDRNIVTYQGETFEVATQGVNFRYFFSYQLNFMYWRYFLWNFVGRQSDIQGTGDVVDGNWLSGVKFVDALYLGPQDNIPSEMAANKARNKYYFLPFILGLAGLIFQLGRDRRGFAVVMWLFFMTGIALVVFFNVTPGAPRERNYIFTASSLAFSIWVGLGVPYIKEILSRIFKRDNAVMALTATLVCSSVPIILVAQNWDDHDRSHRYVARDLGYNYLESSLPNSIIINYGDNDTFPLWYNQEVESVRTDTRAMNVNYMNSSWYIDQMRVRSRESAPVPFSLPRSKYMFVNFVPVVDVVEDTVYIRDVMNFIKSENRNSKVELTSGNFVDFIPARHIAVPVNRENVLASGIVAEKDADLIEDVIYIEISKKDIDKSELMLLDLLDSFEWNRPVFFTSVLTPMQLGLADYLQFDGFCYRLVPIKTPVESWDRVGRIDTEYLYDLLMNKYRYGNIQDPRVYVDYFTHHLFSAIGTRSAYARLAVELMKKGDTARAVEVLDAAIEKMPFSQLRHSGRQTIPLVEAYYMAGEYEKGNAVLEDYSRILEEYLLYFLRFTGRKADLVSGAVQDRLTDMEYLFRLSAYYGQNTQAESILSVLKLYGYQ